MIVFSTPVAAAPPPPQPTPTQCLNEFSSNDNYVGDGWVGARVAGPPQPVDLAGVPDPVDREYSLFCGDILSGVVHTAHPESTGTVHPIPPGDEGFFVSCWSEIIRRGVPEEQSDGRIRFRYEYGFEDGKIMDVVPVPLVAQAIVDKERRFTYTFFTGGGKTTGQGNKWFDCATAFMRQQA